MTEGALSADDVLKFLLDYERIHHPGDTREKHLQGSTYRTTLVKVPVRDLQDNRH